MARWRALCTRALVTVATLFAGTYLGRFWTRRRHRMGPIMSESAETGNGRTLRPMEVPASKADAHRLLENLGHENPTVWRIEEDRILASGSGGAFTVCLDFDDAAQIVRIREVEGWPV